MPTRKQARTAPPAELLDTWFWPHVDMSGGSTACWPWTRSTMRTGYGQVARQDFGGHWTTHALAYAGTHGEVPALREIDHTCHNRETECPGGPECLHRRCCNPNHLEAVTPGQNRARADALRERGAAKKVCPKGHPLDGVVHRRTGPRAGAVHRYCMQCARDNQARMKAKK